MVTAAETSRRMITRTARASRLLRGLRCTSGGRITSTFDSATGIKTRYTYQPNTNYVQAETSVTSASSVVNPTDHGSMTTDQKTIGISERLFTDHYSLLIERSAAVPAAKSHGVTKGKTAIGDNKPKTTPDEVTAYG